MKKTTTKSAKHNAERTTTPAAESSAKIVEPCEETSTTGVIDEYLSREAAIYNHRWPEEVLRNYRIENYWEVNKIAAEAERRTTEATAVDVVRQFLRFNSDSRAALDLFAAVASLKYDVKERRKETE